jgi:hypothetical protein
VDGTELSGKRFFVIPSRYGNGPEAHLRSKLNSQMA